MPLIFLWLRVHNAYRIKDTFIPSSIAADCRALHLPCMFDGIDARASGHSVTNKIQLLEFDSLRTRLNRYTDKTLICYELVQVLLLWFEY